MTMADQTVHIAGAKKPCCEVEANLKVIESNALLTVRRCLVCSCRHFEAVLQPGTMLTKPA